MRERTILMGLMLVGIVAWAMAVFCAILVVAAIIDNGHHDRHAELLDRIKAGDQRNAENQKEIEKWRTKYRIEKSAPR